MLVVFVVEIIADDDDAAIDAELWSGHGGGELVWVVLFPFKRVLIHLGDDIFDLIINNSDLGGFFAE